MTAADFSSVRATAREGVVLDRSALRLVLPVSVDQADIARVEQVLSEDDHVWRTRDAPTTMVGYARTISETWEAHGAALLKRRGKHAALALLPPRRPDADGSVAARFTLARFDLYRDAGLAFISVVIQPAEGGVPVADWIDIAACARFIADDKRIAGLVGDELLPTLGSLVELVHQRLLGRSPATGDRSVSMNGQVLLAGSWFVTGVADDDSALVRYAVRSHFNSRMLIGATEEQRTGRAGFVMAYALRQDFVSTLEGTHFVAFDAPDHGFFNQTLPDHIETIYFPAWLFALQQRYFLLGQISQMAVEALSERALTGEERFREIEGHAQALARFEARGYEIQLYQAEHHHRYWDSIREVLDIEALHTHLTGLMQRALTRAQAARAAEQGARERLREDEERERATSAAARERALELRIIVALAFPGLLLGIAGMNIRGWTADSSGSPWWVAAAIGLAGGLIVVGALAYGSHRSDDGA